MKTIEQKAKAYDEAIERAKAFNKRWQCIQAIDSELALKELKEIFPEFTENEDERIRKEIIYHIQNCDDTIDEETEKRMIAWLEKQGGNLVENGYTNNKDYIKYADNYSHEIWYKLMDNLKNIKDYHIGCNDVSDIVLNAIIDTCNWLEKQSEQNLADNVEPKFHKGDWIIHQGTENIYQVVARIDNQYQLKYGDNYTVQKCVDVDRCARLWNATKDAKDGDVLVSQCGRPFIYNGNRDSILIGSYCGISVDGNFRVATEKCHWTENMNIHPATKEQRDTLIKAITDAGFTFDFEKKELKKITDEDLPFSAKDSELQEATYYIPKGFHAEIDDDKVVIKKGEKPTTWNKDDSYMLQQAIKCVNNSGKLEVSTEEIEDWLKDLKQRITNKQ